MVGILQGKDWYSRFIFKSDHYRHVRSIRVIDENWEKFGEMALERGITQADLLKLHFYNLVSLTKQGY